MNESKESGVEADSDLVSDIYSSDDEFYTDQSSGSCWTPGHLSSSSSSFSGSSPEAKKGKIEFAVPKRGRPTKKGKRAAEGEDSVEPKSDLEMLRDQNILARKNFIEQSGLLEAKEQLMQDVTKIKPKAVKDKKCPALPLRERSNRKAAIQADAALCENKKKSLENATTYKFLQNFRSEGSELDFQDCYAPAYKEEDVELFIQVAKIIEQESFNCIGEKELVNMPPEMFKSRMGNLRPIDNLAMPEIRTTKFCSVAFHRSVSPLLVASGTKDGSLCLWKIQMDVENMERGVSQAVAFDVNTNTINHLAFGEKMPHFLYFSSKDGCFKNMDLNREKFSLIYKVPSPTDNNDPSWITWHKFYDANTVVASTSNGRVLKIDTRENLSLRNSVSEFKCHESSINTVDVLGENILTASDDGTFSMWDVKSMQRSTARSQTNSIDRGRIWSMHCNTPVSAAFFSPVNSGKRILTSTKEVNSVYDYTQDGAAPFKTFSAYSSSKGLKKGRVPKAFWHPMVRGMFLMGTSEQPRTGIHIFNAKYCTNQHITPCHSDFYLPDLGSTRAIFHPSRLVVASCCGSKLRVFV